MRTIAQAKTLMFGKCGPLWTLALLIMSLIGAGTLVSFKEIYVKELTNIYVNNPKGENKFYEARLKHFDNEYLKQIKISIKFKSDAASPNFTNLIQTNREGRGLRLEQHLSGEKTRIFLQYRDLNNREQSFFINKFYNPYEWNTIDVIISRENRITIFLNSSKVESRSIPWHGVEVDELAIGTGLSKSRIFHGDILANFSYKVFVKRDLLPVNIILFVWILFFAYLWKNKINLISKVKTPDLLSIIICVYVALTVQSKKPFANFFGDDFLALWPIRSTSIFQILNENVAGAYRPITSIVYLLRFKIQGYDIESWRVTNLILVAAVTISLYAMFRFMSLNSLVASLSTITYVVSPVFMASMFWWPTPGTQHAISQVLSCVFIIYVIRSYRLGFSQKTFFSMQSLALILTLTAEIYAPLLAVTILTYLWFLNNAHMLGKGSQEASLKRQKWTTFQIRKRKPRIMASLFRDKFILFWILSVLFWHFCRIYIAGTKVAVAAGSAKNFDFSSLDLPIAFMQFIKYLLSFIGIFSGEAFFDIGAGNGRISSPTEQNRLFLVLAVLVFTSLLTTSIKATIVKLKGSIKVKRVLNDVEFPTLTSNHILVLVMLLMMIPAALVPDYMQLRWVQLPYSLALYFIVKSFRSSLAKQLILLQLILLNLLVLQFNFVPNLWVN